MMDQVCNEIKRVLLAGVGLADKGIQKVGQEIGRASCRERVSSPV